MQFRKNLLVAILTLGGSLLAAQAHAILINKSDVTIQNPAGASVKASAAVLGRGSFQKAKINSLPGLFAGDSWSPLDLTNRRSTKFNDTSFLLNAGVRKSSGAWGLQWSGTQYPDYMDFVLVLNSGKQWSAYLLDGVSMANMKKLSGTFSMPRQTNKKRTKYRASKLSVAGIYGRVGKAPTVVVAGNGSSSSVVVTVPPVILPPAANGGAGGNGGGNGGAGGNGGGYPVIGGGGPLGNGGDNGGASGNGGAGDPNAMPNPGTLALLFMGLGLVLLHLRRKNI